MMPPTRSAPTRGREGRGPVGPSGGDVRVHRQAVQVSIVVQSVLVRLSKGEGGVGGRERRQIKHFLQVGQASLGLFPSAFLPVALN